MALTNIQMEFLSKVPGELRNISRSLKVIADRGTMAEFENYLYVLRDAISFSDPIGDEERIAAKAQLELLDILIAKIKSNEEE